METWWDSSHKWSTAVEEHRPVRKDGLGMQEKGVALYVRDQVERMELCLVM